MADLFFKNVATFGTVGNGDSLYVQEGGLAMITNVDQSGRGANGLAKLAIAAAFAANIGTHSAPFKAQMQVGDGTVINAAKAGTLYLQADGGADTDVIDELHVVGLSTTWLVGGGTFTDNTIESGFLVVDEEVTLTHLRATGGLTRLLNPAEAGGFLVNLYIGPGAEVVCARGVSGEVQQWGGVSTWDAFTETLAKYVLMAGMHDVSECGTITLYEWRGGLLNIDRLSRPLTITTLEVWPGVSDEDLQAVLGNDNLTVTNDVVYR